MHHTRTGQDTVRCAWRCFPWSRGALSPFEWSVERVICTRPDVAKPGNIEHNQGSENREGHWLAFFWHGCRPVPIPLATPRCVGYVQVVEAACAVGHMLHGKSLENVASGIDCHTVKQPWGVVAGICPFNFPAMVLISSLFLPALCQGQYCKT